MVDEEDEMEEEEEEKEDVSGKGKQYWSSNKKLRAVIYERP